MRPNISALLSVTAVLGVAGTGVLSAMARPAADERLVKAREEKQEDLTFVEKVVAAAPAYGRAIFCGVAASACILGANVLNRNSQASMAGAYALLDRFVREYRESVRKRYSAEADEEIVADIVRCNPAFHQLGVDKPDRKLIFVDPYTGERFERYEREMMDAEYHMNRNYQLYGGVSSLNDWRKMQGLEELADGDKKGWTVGDEIYWLDFAHRVIGKDENGRDLYQVEVFWEPTEDYLER